MVDSILFSPDGNLLLVAGYKAGVVLLYRCKLNFFLNILILRHFVVQPH